MIQTTITISLLCLAIHVLCWESHPFHKPAMIIREIIWLCVGIVLCFFSPSKAADYSDKIADKLIRPIFDCLICMSSLWTIILGHYLFHITQLQDFIIPMLLVCAFNTILDSVIYYLRDGSTKL
jgi:hypothetical protein